MTEIEPLSFRTCSELHGDIGFPACWVVTVSDSYEERLTEIFPGKNLYTTSRLLHRSPYEPRAFQNGEHSTRRDDVRHLARPALSISSTEGAYQNTQAYSVIPIEKI